MEQLLTGMSEGSLSGFAVMGGRRGANRSGVDFERCGPEAFGRAQELASALQRDDDLALQRVLDVLSRYREYLRLEPARRERALRERPALARLVDAVCRHVYGRAEAWMAAAGPLAARLASSPEAWGSVEQPSLQELRDVVRDWVLDPEVWSLAGEPGPVAAENFDDLVDIADPACMVIVGHLAPHLAERRYSVERVTGRPGRLDAGDWAAAFAQAMLTWDDPTGWDVDRFAQELIKRQGRAATAQSVG